VCGAPTLLGLDACGDHHLAEQFVRACDPHTELWQTAHQPGLFERMEAHHRAELDDRRRIPVLASQPATPYGVKRWGAAALDGIFAELANRVADGEGRNTVLTSVAFKVGRLVGGEQVAEGVLGELLKIAVDICPDERRKATDTVRRAFRRGLEQPRAPRR